MPLLFTGPLAVLNPDQVARLEGFAPWARHGTGNGTGNGSSVSVLRRASAWAQSLASSSSAALSIGAGKEGGSGIDSDVTPLNGGAPSPSSSRGTNGFYSSLASSSSADNHASLSGYDNASSASASASASDALHAARASSSVAHPSSTQSRFTVTARAAAASSSSSSRASGCGASGSSSGAGTVEVVVGPPLSSVSQFTDFYSVCNPSASKYVVAISRPSLTQAARATPSSSTGTAASYARSCWSATTGWWRRTCGRSATKPQVQLLLMHDAAWRDVITGYLHAVFVAGQIAAGNHPDFLSPAQAGSATTGVDGLASLSQLHADLDLVVRGGLFVAAYGDALLQDLETAGWWVGQPLLERHTARRISVAAGSDGPLARIV